MTANQGPPPPPPPPPPARDNKQQDRQSTATTSPYDDDSPPEDNNPKNAGTYSDDDDENYGDVDAIEAKDDSDLEQGDKNKNTTTTTTTTTTRTPFPYVHCVSNAFFLLGSILYIVLSVEDVYWAQQSQCVPWNVKTVTDDATWEAWAASNGNWQERRRELMTTLRAMNDTTSSSSALVVSLDFDKEDDAVVWNTATNTTTPSSNTTTNETTHSNVFADNNNNNNNHNNNNATLNPLLYKNATTSPSTTTDATTQDDNATTTTEDDDDLNNNNMSTTTTTTTSTVDPSHWYDFWWTEMPLDIQEHWATLGYDETTWNEGLPIASEDLSWDELTVEQQQAATALGYSEASWDGETMAPTAMMMSDETTEGTDNNNSTTPTNTVSPGYYDDWDWAELPPDIQQAATVLGYSQSMWDNGEVAAATSDLWWRELTASQQQAAARLGYDADSWDFGIGPDIDTDVVEAHLKCVELNDDDSVFYVEPSSVWVTRYQMIYFCAALCFVYVGVLDYYRTHEWLNMFMILAGIFGLIAAMLVERDVRTSNIFNVLSSHFFLLDFVGLVGSRVNRHRRIQERRRHPGMSVDRDDDDDDDDDEESPAVGAALWFADICFGIGALGEVVLSYVYLLGGVATDFDFAIIGVGIAAAVVWMPTALVYSVTTILEYQRRKRRDEEFWALQEQQQPPDKTRVSKEIIVVEEEAMG